MHLHLWQCIRGGASWKDCCFLSFQYESVHTDNDMNCLQITGGMLFLAFGVHALYEGVYDSS